MALNKIEIDTGQVDTWTGAPIYSYRLEDDKTGDLYEGVRKDNVDPFGWNPITTYEPGQLIATGEALKNPDIQNFTGYNLRGSDNPGQKYTDPVFAQQFYELKQADPTAYYNQLASDLGNQIAENTAWNKGEHNVGFTNQLNQIKEINPQAYYTAQLGILGDSVGWQIGQNRSDRNAPTLEKIQSLVPEAMSAGLTADQINSIVNNSVNAANAQNQFRIANEAASGGSGFNLGELVRGIAPVAALAIGAPFLDAALAGGAAAGSAAGGLSASSVPSLIGGLEVGAGSALAGTGAGAAAIPAGGALASLGSLAWTPPAIGGSAGFFAPTLGADIASTGIGLSAANVPSLVTGLELGASAATGSSLLSNAGDLLKGAQLAKGLLGAGQNPLQAQPMGVQPQQQQQAGRQYAGVDYSPILNLLALKSPTRTNSLLG